MTKTKRAAAGGLLMLSCYFVSLTGFLSGGGGKNTKLSRRRKLDRKKDIYQLASPDGHFRRQPSTFRSTISRAPNAPFPPEKDRYVLYLTTGCPWAHRTNIVRTLKGLEPIIQLVLLDPRLGPDGWRFSGEHGSAPQDPLYGFTYLRELYEKAEPGYVGRYTVPVLWDRKRETIVSNESAEIIRFLDTEFEAVVAPGDAVGYSLYPERLRAEIDEMNAWVYDRVNNGVYKAGFAATQEAYEENVYPLFEALDRIEAHLGSEEYHGPYLFGEQITEADVRLFTTIVRFDVAYYAIFRCSLKMIRHDYPRIHRWLRTLYWDESERTAGGAFRKTTDFDALKLSYSYTQQKQLGNTNTIISAGPYPHILPL
ncbi:hypothetical protein FQN55_001730 [Onygenales sp. PD_40]|nr:hypothetical protein FQN55_001730 [Onygenales sp. PD_40]